VDSYQIDIITDYGRFRKLKNDWNRLARNDPSIYPFICFEWFDLWFTSFAKTSQMHIYLLKDGTDIRAILPLIKYRGAYKKIPGIIIKCAINEHSHKMELISDKKDVDGYVNRLMDELCSEDFLVVHFEDFLADSESAKLILNFFENTSEKTVFSKRYDREVVVFDVSMGWDNFKQTLPKKSRKNINYLTNTLRKSGDISIIRYHNYDHLPHAFECIQQISSKSWQGRNKTGLFSRKDTRDFYKGLAEFASRDDLLSIWVLYIDGTPVSYEYHFHAGSNEYALKAEYDQEYSNLSPGAVLDAHIVQNRSKGYTGKYDLMGYKEWYKTHWSKNTDKYITIYVFKRNLIGRTIHYVDFILRERLRKNTLARSVKLIFNSCKKDVLRY